MPDRAEELRVRLMATFSVEAEDHLNAIAGQLSVLDQGADATEKGELIEGLFRAVHTLKGAARSVGLVEVESLCQGLEATLSRARKTRAGLSREELQGVHEGVDQVARLVAGVRSEGRAPGPPGPSQPAPPGPLPGSIRVDPARLDTLQLRAEELLAVRASLEERVREARGLLETLEQGTPEGAGPNEGWQAARGRARDMVEHIRADERAVASTVAELEGNARRLRMMPVSTLLEPFSRMVGELARGQGKEVAWDVAGAEMEADRKVLEAIKAPLLHLVRNAVDHGIELPEGREAAGKSRRGRVGLRVSMGEARRIELCLEDDGAGIDPERVKAAAVRARVVSGEEAKALSDADAMELTFHSGVSTSPMVTTVSGHGLGMAIAREAVERLGGEIRIESTPGAGTRIRLLLPATVASFRGLLVRAGGQPFLVPVSSVQRALRLPGEAPDSAGHGRTLLHGGRVLPLGPLAAAIGSAEDRPAAGNDALRPCLVLSEGDERGALLVDEVMGEREVLLKEFKAPLRRLRGFQGAGVLGSGELVLILRPSDLLRRLREGTVPRAAPARQAPVQPAILVVDDSITTRTMERNLLEAAGYKVHVAVDGREAWTILKTERFDLVLTDVDMPRLNGFDLTARIRADAALADLPVILVTALESREDKERGVEVGANAYVIKSGFDQSKLLEMVRRLI